MGINNYCGLELFNLSTLLGYSQLINEPTNFEPSKLPSCIDLLFTSQPNLISESGVHPSLCRTCHHQIIYTKINFKVHLPPPFKREIWHYNRAESELIRRSIKAFDWEQAFLNLSINDQVELFNNTLLNIFRNFIPHETIKCSLKDPPWIDNEIKNALRRKNRVYKKYISNGRLNEDEIHLQEITAVVSELITSKKEVYFLSLGKKLSDPCISSKDLSQWALKRPPDVQ